MFNQYFVMILPINYLHWMRRVAVGKVSNEINPWFPDNLSKMAGTRLWTWSESYPQWRCQPNCNFFLHEYQNFRRIVDNLWCQFTSPTVCRAAPNWHHTFTGYRLVASAHYHLLSCGAYNSNKKTNCLGIIWTCADTFIR